MEGLHFLCENYMVACVAIDTYDLATAIGPAHTLCAFLKMLVKIPSSQSPVAEFTQPNMSKNSSSAWGKTRASFTFVAELCWSALSVAITVLSAVVLPVAGFPAIMTAACVEQYKVFHAPLAY